MTPYHKYTPVLPQTLDLEQLHGLSPKNAYSPLVHAKSSKDPADRTEQWTLPKLLWMRTWAHC